MKTKENPYEKKYVTKSTQHINISEYREMDFKTLVDKLEQELKKRKNNLFQKGSDVQSFTFTNVALSASMCIKRLETDAEYNKRIAAFEKQEAAKRKKEEDKIKKEFKKLKELESKFQNISSEEEAIMKLRMEKTSNNIITINS